MKIYFFFLFFCEWISIFNKKLLILFHEWICSFCFNDESMSKIVKNVESFFKYNCETTSNRQFCVKIYFEIVFYISNNIFAIFFYISFFSTRCLICWYEWNYLCWNENLSWFHALFICLFNRECRFIQIMKILWRRHVVYCCEIILKTRCHSIQQFLT